MTAARQNILIEQGATFNLRLEWTDSDQNPVDLTGFHVRSHIRPRLESETILLDLDSNESNILIDFAPLDETGVIDITVSALVTEQLDFASAVYDLEVESPDGTVTRLVQGRVRLSREVTR
jgi:hypothetical protein